MKDSIALYLRKEGRDEIEMGDRFNRFFIKTICEIIDSYPAAELCAF